MLSNDIELYDIGYVLNRINEVRNNSENYLFLFRGDVKIPVDVRPDKYKLWSKWFERGSLKCFGCGREPMHFMLRPCNGSGDMYKGFLKKHSFALVGDINKNGKYPIFTGDHWFPRKFIRGLNLYGLTLEDNIVPMCDKCNGDKKDHIPKMFKWAATTYKPILSTIDGDQIEKIVFVSGKTRYYQKSMF